MSSVWALPEAEEALVVEEDTGNHAAAAGRDSYRARLSGDLVDWHNTGLDTAAHTPCFGHRTVWGPRTAESGRRKVSDP